MNDLLGDRKQLGNHVLNFTAFKQLCPIIDIQYQFAFIQDLHDMKHEIVHFVPAEIIICQNTHIIQINPIDKTIFH
ncbi:hypothetical protein D1872_196410 [compost metagenome]